MEQNFCSFFYLVSALLFIMGLKKTTHPQTAKVGNLLSIAGMFFAITATLIFQPSHHGAIVTVALFFGSVLGIVCVKKTLLTDMPQLIALFNGLGGFASFCIAFILCTHNHYPDFIKATLVFTAITGMFTFSGSLVAWGKLSQNLASRVLLFLFRFFRFAKFLNLLLLFSIIFTGLLFVFSYQSYSYLLIVIISGMCFFFGIILFVPVGGADMPVIISLLNSLSGLAASFSGFAIKNTLLIISGSLVGASGFILTTIMCKAMNRNLWKILFGDLQNKDSKTKEASTNQKIHSIFSESASYLLESSKKILIVPGYGLAVAQAQHLLQELSKILKSKNTEIIYVVHPVAGRMPGHMNVLLAEANIPYEEIIEMETMNEKMEMIDLALVIGANDVVNPSSREKTSPLYGMPIVNVDQAKMVIVFKRSMATGFAGIANPLFFLAKTSLLFGDAKESLQQLIDELKKF